MRKELLGYQPIFTLKQTLKERNITQAELAEMTGLRPNAISNICRGYVDRISISHITKICQALEIEDVNMIVTVSKQYGYVAQKETELNRLIAAESKEPYNKEDD